MEIIIKRKNNYLQYFLCMVVLFLPVAFINITSFYSVSTPIEIWYKYKTFNFSFLIIPLIIYASFIKQKSYAIRFDRVIVAIAFKDIFFYYFGVHDKIITFDFSLYLILITAWALTVVSMKCNNNINTIPGKAFFEAYFLIAFLTILLRMALGLTTDGRYGAIGLSVGGTGFFAGIFVIYLIYACSYTKKTPYYLFLSFFILILSGQRTNLLFCLLFCLLYIIRHFFLESKKNNQNDKSSLLGCVLWVGIALLLGLLLLNEMGVLISGLNYITRILDAVERFIGGSINNESSISGRLKSIDAGIQILKDNPLGIVNVFYDLQYKMIVLNYPTFPHSTLLACALLWSTPIIIICEIWVLRLLFSLLKLKNDMFWVILYLQITLLFWGGPFLDFPLLFIILLLLSMAQYIVVNGQNY